MQAGVTSSQAAIAGTTNARPRVMLVTLGGPGGLGRAELLLQQGLAEVAVGGQVALRTLRKRPHPAHLSEGGQLAAWNARGSKPRLLLYALRWAAIWHPDLLVVSHINLAPVSIAAKRLKLIPRVVTVVHGLEVWEKLSRLQQLGVDHSDAIWSPSEYSRAMLVRTSGVPSEVVRVLPWSLMREHAAASPIGRDRAPGRPEILSVTRLDAVDGNYKGVGDVIQALPRVHQRVPDVTYRVVGDGNGRPPLEALTRELGLQNQVRFLGAIGDDALADAYRTCQVFALPSEGEGFGLVFIEAMAAGKPVVAARAGAASEVVVDGRTGVLVPFGDVPALATALTSLLADAPNALRMGEAGQDLVARQFTFVRFVERLEPLVADMLEQRRPGRGSAAVYRLSGSLPGGCS